MKTTLEIMRSAKSAVPAVSAAPSEQKNQALLMMADCLQTFSGEILKENALDVEEARGTVSDVMIDRLSLTKERIVLEGNIPSSIHPPAGCKFHTRCFMACEKCKVIPPALTEVKPGHFVACHFADQKKVDENGQYLFTVCKGTNAR